MKHDLSTDQDFTLKTLELTNFMCYKDLKLDFNNKDIVGITAQYIDNKTRSNRGGKSALTEAVRYNLVGKSRIKTDKELIHSGEKHMLVKCVYTDGVKDYVVRRGCDSKGKGLLEIDWVTNIREAQDEIGELFGVSQTDFDLTNFFKQADIKGFMGMKPAEKTSFLMGYIENQHWSEKEALAKADLTVVKQKIRDNDNLRSTLENALEVDISLEGMKQDVANELVIVSNDLKNQRNKLAEINSKIKNISDSKKEIQTNITSFKSTLIELKEEMVKADEQLKSIESLKNIIEKAKTSASLIKVEKTEKEINDVKLDILTKIDGLKSQVNSAGKNKGICPIIKKECNSIAFTQKQVEKFSSEITNYQNNINDLNKELQNIADLKETENVIYKKRTQLKAIIDNKLNKEDLLKKQTETTKLLKNKTDDLQELNIDLLNNKKEEISEVLQNFETKTKILQDKINKFDVRIQQSKNAKEKIDKLVLANESLKKELSLLNYTTYMFSKKGIPSGEIEDAFGEIEDKINYCLENLNAGLNISFSADKETNEKEPICQCGHEFEKGFKGKDCPECATPRQYKRREEINFSVVEGDREQNFDLDSGGGQQIICYAVKIALTYFKRRMSKCRLNMLFLDEIDSALDPYLANQVISSVTNFLTEKLGFKQILMVSHKEQIKNSMPYMIKVTRHETYSTARFV